LIQGVIAVVDLTSREAVVMIEVGRSEHAAAANG
jgi:hypothetical protein